MRMNILLTSLLIIGATADNEGRVDNRVGLMLNIDWCFICP